MAPLKRSEQQTSTKTKQRWHRRLKSLKLDMNEGMIQLIKKKSGGVVENFLKYIYKKIEKYRKNGWILRHTSLAKIKS